MNLSDWVVVFDLDDTLISEREYERSGISAVEKCVSSLYGSPFEGRIQGARDAGIQDLWTWTCEQLDLPLEVKKSLLWIYRLHHPRINLPDLVRKLIERLALKGTQLVILSDGRSVTQRLKLRAVGLEDWPVFLSEDYQSLKPAPERFEEIEKQWPRRRYVYVGDNPTKDFIAPLSRSWLTIGARWIFPRVHAIPADIDLSFQPHYWCDDPLDVDKILSLV